MQYACAVYIVYAVSATTSNKFAGCKLGDFELIQVPVPKKFQKKGPGPRMLNFRNGEEMKMIIKYAQNPHQTRIRREKTKNLWLIGLPKPTMLLRSTKN